MTAGTVSSIPASQSPANGPTLISRQPPAHPGMGFHVDTSSVPPAKQWGEGWVVEWVEQQAFRLTGGCGALGCGANKDKDDDRLAEEQRARQEQQAAASMSTVPGQPLPALQVPPPAAPREPRASQASKRSASLQEGGPAPVSQPQPSRRAPAKTLPPNLAPPVVRTRNARTVSMGPSSRPGL